MSNERDELRHPSAQPAAAAAATARELQEAREALRVANARMENMLESLVDGFCAVDHQWRIMYINGRALEMLAPLQKTRPSLVGHDLWASFPELRGSMLETVYRRAMVSRETAIQEFFWPALKRWFEVRAHPSPDGLTLYFQDINRRKADQQALQQGNSRLQVALAAGRLGDWRWDAASDRVMLGERAAAIFGLPAEQPLAWSELRARIDPGDRESVRRAVLQAFAGHSDLELECRLPGPSGEPRWVALVGRADYADQARREGVLGMTGVVQDVTARRSAADALRQSEEVLRALANTIPQLAWMAQADGAIVWFNERWFEYTGTTPDQVVGWGWQTAVEPTVLPAVLERWSASIKSGNPFEMEYPIRGADGQYRWFLTRVNPVRDRHGKVLRWFGTDTDVDEVKRAEQALRDESHVLELLNSTGSALASTRDLRSLLQVATDAATGIAGARQGAFLYHGRNDGIEPDANNLFTLYTVSGGSPVGFEAFGAAGPTGLFGPGLLDHPAGVIRSGDVTLDARLRDAPPFGLPAGHPAVRSYLAVPVVGHSGELLGTMFFGHPEADVFSERTERIVRGIAAQAAVAIDNVRLYEAAQRAAEERKVLLESERQARAEAERTSQMKDEFLATLSHELRTPLSAILGWAQVLRRGSRDQNDLQKGLQTIERNARAQAQLIEDLLDMSRITSGKVLLDMQAVAPASFIDAAIETVRPAADAKNIRIDKQYAADPGLVAGDPARLQQVVWNLLSNAIKFTPRDGQVGIELARNDTSVAITVRDNGAGIRPEFITHVFERFRQADASMTRRHGGLGLGLAIVKHLIEQHGGTVRAESAGEGKGASFTIELPLAKQQPPATRSARAAMILPTPATPEMTVLDLSGVNVLVVDDDRDARELIKRILSDCGASVRIAASARDAFALFKERVPNLLISDLGMPEVDGFELLDWVRHLGREEGSQVPAIALTAFARSEDRLSALEAGFSAHISKPVEPSELIATVASVVGPSSPFVNRADAATAGRNGVR
ncbi:MULTISPECIES: ATP-binding protein [unclassified Massilia]|uniref:hybrid sensor histidine kinase/response regulator n=1 Tax=unclassified Massilia TaxID=2609279 RepID=UPI000A9945E8|nr:MULTISPECIES: ATP-binding protein [unclassified Massilia]